MLHSLTKNKCFNFDGLRALTADVVAAERRGNRPPTAVMSTSDRFETRFIAFTTNTVFSEAFTVSTSCCSSPLYKTK